MTMDTKSLLTQGVYAGKGRRYHTRERLVSRSVVVIDGELLTGTETGLAGLIMEIPGVTGVQLERYSLTVTKAPLYSWAEIDPAVLEVVQSFSGLEAGGK